uniref:Alpha-type protein kinase domain-containing protein n=1 Tax=Bionectria ochroleuca TaxID=29856 RepID=A0A0B7KCM4_BIOOC
MDTTSSMDPYMSEAKAQVRSIISEIREAFFGEAEVRISIVSYKDHGDEPNIQWLDFTPDADAARAFLENLYAEGGGDPPEDVLGGIQQAINASWRAYTRCMIHIADAPPHGRIFHDSDDDTYPEPGSEPHRLTYKPLIRKLTELRINYALLRTGEYTDKMADLFMQEYRPAATVCRLHKSNGYYPLSMVKGTSNGSPGKKGIQFQELELGTTYSALRHLIVQSVTSSASLTATYLANLEEEFEGSDDIKLSLETSTPKWDSLSWFGEKVNVEGFSPTVIVHGFQTLNDMMASDDNIIMGPVELSLRWRSKPFSHGATRQASYARTEASTDRFVVKSPLKSSRKMVHLVEDMRCQALCRAFALEFNGLVGYRFSLNFIVTICFEGRDKVRSDADCLSLEPFIPGHYVKYNGNNGWLPEGLEDNDIFKASQAFSHFTTAYGLKMGYQSFRTNWPSVENTLFCSNKLCGQIVVI